MTSYAKIWAQTGRPLFEMHTVLITGSRSLNGNQEVEADVYRILNELHATHKDEMVLLSGGAKGVDRIGENWASEHNVACKVWKPDYKQFRRAAPLIRNKQMVDACDDIVAFWDGKSKGTKHAMEHGKTKTRVCIQYS